MRAMPAPSPISTRPRHALAQLPAAPGVYRFRGRDGRVLYIGRATELRHRVASYWSNLGDRRRLAPMVRRIDRIEAIACDSVHEAAWLERNLLETTMPRWNRTAGGQEVPVYVRLDARPTAPGVSVVHADRLGGAVQVFGPYLGGLRVRQAVSGLHRILPLAYTARTLSGAEREMARLRGVAEVDRDRVVATHRRRARAGTRGRGAGAYGVGARPRDRASDALAFELAGRVQAEIDALDWITSPQRVTTADARGISTSTAGTTASSCASRSAPVACAPGRSGHVAMPGRKPTWPRRRMPGAASRSGTPSSPWRSLRRRLSAPSAPGRLVALVVQPG